MHARGERVHAGVDPCASGGDPGREDQIGLNGCAQVPARGRGCTEPGQSGTQPDEVTRVHRGERTPPRFPPLNGAHVHRERFREPLLRKPRGLARELESVAGHDARRTGTLTPGQRCRSSTHGRSRSGPFPTDHTRTRGPFCPLPADRSVITGVAGPPLNSQNTTGRDCSRGPNDEQPTTSGRRRPPGPFGAQPVGVAPVRGGRVGAPVPGHRAGEPAAGTAAAVVSARRSLPTRTPPGEHRSPAGSGPRPNSAGTCPACGAHGWAAIPHPRAGTEFGGVFVGNLFEVVTRDARA